MTAAQLILDASGVRRLADQSTASLALIRSLRDEGLWPPVVPSVVVVDALTGDAERDAPIVRLLECCKIVTNVARPIAERAAWLRTAAGRGVAADAIVVALAEPRGAVLTGGRRDAIEAMALFADEVFAERA